MVTFVVVLTWIVAIVSIVSGVFFLVASDATLADTEITGSTATYFGWIEIVFGVITAAVAIGLGKGNRFARLVVTILMLLRIASSIWAAIALWGHTGFGVAAGTGLIALVILTWLWSDRSRVFFAAS
jgi:hypothetical protein